MSTKRLPAKLRQQVACQRLRCRRVRRYPGHIRQGALAVSAYAACICLLVGMADYRFFGHGWSALIGVGIFVGWFVVAKAVARSIERRRGS